jgi:hypothetical protein
VPKRKLIYQYYIKGSRSAEARQKHFELVLELMETEELSFAPVNPNTSAPDEEYEETYRRLADAFSAALARDPERPLTLRNYCGFFCQRDPGRALEAAEKLVHLEPDHATNHMLNAYARERLVREIDDEDEKRRHHEKVLDSLNKVMSLRGGDLAVRDTTLGKIAWLAYRLGHEQEARDAAGRALEASARILSEPGLRPAAGPELMFDAHSVLGLLALDQGDVTAASEHLLASVESPPTSQLHFVVLDLGRRLLALGASSSVREFAERLRVAVGCGPWQRHAAEFRAEVARASAERLPD